MAINGNQTYCGNNFSVYTNAELLCCPPETNIMLNVTYTSVKIKYNKCTQNMVRNSTSYVVHERAQ